MPDSRSFGPFVFDPRTATLRREGQVVAIGTRAAALLERLLAANGSVVDKDALVEAAWPDAIVEEGNLAVQVGHLRRALGTRSDGQEWIVTVPRVGYRLLPEPAIPADHGAGIPSLLVLPFANVGADPEQDYFADGIVDDIITGLSRFRSFAVLARNSSFSYRGRPVDARQVAAELGARYVLEGGVRRAGRQLRVNAHLSDARTGAHLWAQTFDGGVEDVFEVQDRITAAVVAIVVPRIQQAEIDRSRRDRPASLDAYDLYLRAQHIYDSNRIEDSVTAIALLERSIALDPGFAAALADAAHGYEHRLTVGWPPIGPNDRERCLELANAALKLGRDDATVLARCSMALVFIGRDYDRGLSTAMMAVETNPNDVRALTCAGVANLIAGDLHVAMGFFLRVLELNPLDTASARVGIAHVEICHGNYEAAVASATRALALRGNWGPAYWNLIAAHAHHGRLAEARATLASYRASAPLATLATLRASLHSRDPGRIEIIFEGLRRAGLPES